MKKIAVVCCYFGKLPNYFDLWVRSCAANPTIDWLFFTDQKTADLPQNIHLFSIELSKLHDLCKEKISPELILPKAYKLCDYKPLYGTIFSEYLSNYDFWGYCDFDVIFGDLRSFFTDERLEKFDKILPLGHLSIYRNTPDVNSRFQCSGSVRSYKEVITCEKTCAFDEWKGIYAIYKKNSFAMCDDMPFADISLQHKRLTVFRRTNKNKYKMPPPDYPHQVFYWENGKLLRTYIGNHKTTQTDEFLYIHLPRRVFPDHPQCDSFYCTPKGFIPKTEQGEPDRKNIQKLNPYYGKLFEWLEKHIRRKIVKRENHRRFAPRIK